MNLTIVQIAIIITMTLTERSNGSTINFNDNYLSIRPLLQQWIKMYTHPRRITVVFDNYTNERDFHIPSSISDDLSITVNIATLEHLISLGGKKQSIDFFTIETANCVVLLCSDISHISRVLMSPHLSSFWRPENFYIIRETLQHVKDANVDYRGRFLEWSLERLWRLRKIYKMAVSIDDKLIRYDPFKFENHNAGYVYSECELPCDKLTKSRDILTIQDQVNADMSEYCYDYRETFNGYPIQVSIFKSATMPKIGDKYGGMDYKYLEEISRKLNVTPKLSESKLSYGWKENGTFYGPLGDIVYKRVDLSFNQFFVKNYYTEQIEMTMSITSDKLCVVVPRSLPIPAHLVIAQTFTSDTWFLILLSYLVLSLIYTLMKQEFTNHFNEETKSFPKKQVALTSNALIRPRFQNEKHSTMKKNYAIISIENALSKGKYAEITCNRREEFVKERIYVLEVKSGASCLKPGRTRSGGFKAPYVAGIVSFGKYLTKVLVQLMQPLPPARARVSERTLLMCSLIMTLILNGIFTSELTSLFSKLSYFENLRTLEDVDLSGYTMLTESRDLMDDALTDEGSTILENLRQKLEYANETEIYRRVFENRDAGFLQRKGVIFLKFTKFQRDRIHAVEECPRHYDTTHLITKGSPFFARINTLVGWLNSGGFYDKWFNDMSAKLEHPSDDDEEHEIRLKLTIKHFVIPFAILVIGLLCSSIAFICERKYCALNAQTQ